MLSADRRVPEHRDIAATAALDFKSAEVVGHFDHAEVGRAAEGAPRLRGSVVIGDG